MALTQTQSPMILQPLPWGYCEQLVSVKNSPNRSNFKVSLGSFKMNTFHFICQAPTNVCSFKQDHWSCTRAGWSRICILQCNERRRHQLLEKVTNNCLQNYQDRSLFPQLFISSAASIERYKTHSHIWKYYTEVCKILSFNNIEDQSQVH